MPGYANPQNLNRYSYVTNNPLRYTDPTGHMQCEDDHGSCVSTHQVTKAYNRKLEKVRIASKIHKKFNNVTIQDPTAWQLQDLNEIYYGLNQVNGIHGFDGNTNAMNGAFGDVTFVPKYFPGEQVGDANSSTGVIGLEPDATAGTVIHEMGHILDGKNSPHYSTGYSNVFDAGPGATDYGQTNATEDFADSFLAVIKYGPQTTRISGVRVDTILMIIHNYTNFDRHLLP